jgi:hypothetical protein
VPKIQVDCSRIIPFTLFGFFLWGCSLANPLEPPLDMDTRPADFSFEYNWSEGSLPPPYHYEYLIRLQPVGQGQVVFWPDYPGFAGVPEWVESFSPDSDQLDQLYQIMVDQGLFTEAWKAQDDPPVGGSSEWMAVTAHGQNIEIPAFVLPEQAAAVSEIYTALRSLVPQAIWDKLEKQRQEYVEGYPNP